MIGIDGWSNVRSALLAAAVVSVAGCGAQTIAPVVKAPPKATVVPTVSLAFAVKVTSVALPHAHKHHTSKPPVAPVTGKGPHLFISPSHGQPLARTVHVRGQGLPHSAQIVLTWFQGNTASAVSTTAQSNKRGRLATSFSIPGSPPGTYRVVAEYGGIPYAAATYRVASSATLSVSQPGPWLHIHGSRFVPHLRLVLIAYPLAGHKPIVLGRARTNDRGTFSARAHATKLSTGEYVLRAWSSNQVSAQMAQAVFQVVI